MELRSTDQPISRSAVSGLGAAGQVSSTFMKYLISKLYNLVVSLRVFLYQKGIFSSRQLPHPVISIGNLTTGGTGKTPLVAWLANHLNAQGAVLRAGDIVTTGVLTNIYNATSGQLLVANYGSFGTLEIEVT